MICHKKSFGIREVNFLKKTWTKTENWYLEEHKNFFRGEGLKIHLIISLVLKLISWNYFLVLIFKIKILTTKFYK